MTESSNSDSLVSFIIEQTISPEETRDFLLWEREINQVCRNFKGYIKTENYPSSSQQKNKWYTIIYFDSTKNLTDWLDSEERYQLVKMRRNNLSGFYDFVGYKTGLEAWLKQNDNIPRWKQAMAVLLGLYPIVMLETILFSSSPISLPWQILINNIISCSLLTWLVMPYISKLFRFWLSPSKQSLKNNYIGILLILTSLMIMVSLFTAYLH